MSAETSGPDDVEAVYDRVRLSVGNVVWRVGLTVTTFGWAAFPTIYAVEPDLATSPGFWHSARWTLFSIWALTLILVTFKLSRRSAEAYPNGESPSAGAWGAQLALMADRQNETISLVHQLVQQLTDTGADVQHWRRLQERAALHGRVAHVIEGAVRVWRGAGEALLPDEAVIVLVVLADSEPLIIYPPSLVADGEARILTNVLRLSRVLEEGSAYQVALSDEKRSHLPRPLRGSEQAVLVPVIGADAAVIGVLVVALRDVGDAALIDQLKPQRLAAYRILSESLCNVAQQCVDFERAKTGGEGR